MSEEKEITKKNAGVKKLISGELLQEAGVLKNLPFLVFVAFLMVVYVGYGYYADHLIRDVNKEDERFENLHSELQSLVEIYNQESLPSEVADEIEVDGLFERKDPTRKLIEE